MKKKVPINISTKNSKLKKIVKNLNFDVPSLEFKLF